MTIRTRALLSAPTSSWRLLLCVAISLVSFGASAQMGANCGSLKNGYGPFDYSNPTDYRTKLAVVENHHFTPVVASLRGGVRSPAGLVGDLDYTLRAFPNHHRALYSVVKYDNSEDPAHRRPLMKTADCYFQRAITWRPNDGKVHLLYGLYKSQKKQYSEAREHFEKAEQLMPNSAEVQYNIGLVLAKNKEYDKAYAHAVKAYDLGYPLPGLRNILRRAGKWPESTD